MANLSLSAMEKILRKAGAERVSKAAAEEFSAVLEEIGLLIARDAVEYSKHAGRKTILADDLKLAKKKF
ncbi:MAG TPA: histone [archaeon]|nr:histone [archaeon]